MQRDEFLKAFAELSTADKDAIRAELGPISEWQSGCDVRPMLEHMQRMMQKMGCCDQLKN